MKKIIMGIGTVTMLGGIGVLAYLMLNKNSRDKITDCIGDEVENVGKSLKKL